MNDQWNANRSRGRGFRNRGSRGRGWNGSYQKGPLLQTPLHSTHGHFVNRNFQYDGVKQSQEYLKQVATSGTYYNNRNQYHTNFPHQKRHYLTPPLPNHQSPKPPSPLPGSEEYIQREISEKSAFLKHQLALEVPEGELNLTTTFTADDTANNFCDSFFKPNSNISQNCNISSDAQNKNENQNSVRKRSIHTTPAPQNFNVEEIHNKIINHIAKLSYSKKFNIVNNMSGSSYDVALHEINKQKRLQLSNALRDMCDDELKKSEDSSKIINAIIPDFDIKIEELPKRLVEQLSGTLNEDVSNCVFNSSVDPELLFQQAADMLNTTMDIENADFNFPSFADIGKTDEMDSLTNIEESNIDFGSSNLSFGFPATTMYDNSPLNESFPNFNKEQYLEPQLSSNMQYAQQPYTNYPNSFNFINHTNNLQQYYSPEPILDENSTQNNSLNDSLSSIIDHQQNEWITMCKKVDNNIKPLISIPIKPIDMINQTNISSVTKLSSDFESKTREDFISSEHTLNNNKVSETSVFNIPALNAIEVHKEVEQISFVDKSRESLKTNVNVNQEPLFNSPQVLVQEDNYKHNSEKLPKSNEPVRFNSNELLVDKKDLVKEKRHTDKEENLKKADKDKLKRKVEKASVEVDESVLKLNNRQLPKIISDKEKEKYVTDYTENDKERVKEKTNNNVSKLRLHEEQQDKNRFIEEDCSRNPKYKSGKARSSSLDKYKTKVDHEYSDPMRYWKYHEERGDSHYSRRYNEEDLYSYKPDYTSYDNNYPYNRHKHYDQPSRHGYSYSSDEFDHNSQHSQKHKHSKSHEKLKKSKRHRDKSADSNVESDKKLIKYSPTQSNSSKSPKKSLKERLEIMQLMKHQKKGPDSGDDENCRKKSPSASHTTDYEEHLNVASTESVSNLNTEEQKEDENSKSSQVVEEKEDENSKSSQVVEEIPAKENKPHDETEVDPHTETKNPISDVINEDQCDVKEEIKQEEELVTEEFSADLPVINSPLVLKTDKIDLNISVRTDLIPYESPNNSTIIKADTVETDTNDKTDLLSLESQRVWKSPGERKMMIEYSEQKQEIELQNENCVRSLFEIKPAEQDENSSENATNVTESKVKLIPDPLEKECKSLSSTKSDLVEDVLEKEDKSLRSTKRGCSTPSRTSHSKTPTEDSTKPKHKSITKSKERQRAHSAELPPLKTKTEDLKLKAKSRNSSSSPHKTSHSNSSRTETLKKINEEPHKTTQTRSNSSKYDEKRSNKNNKSLKTDKPKQNLPKTRTRDTQTNTTNKNAQIQVNFDEEQKPSKSVAIVQTDPIIESEKPFFFGEKFEFSNRNIAKAVRRRKIIERMFDVDREIERLTKFRQSLYSYLNESNSEEDDDDEPLVTKVTETRKTRKKLDNKSNTVNCEIIPEATKSKKGKFVKEESQIVNNLNKPSVTTTKNSSVKKQNATVVKDCRKNRDKSVEVVVESNPEPFKNANTVLKIKKIEIEQPQKLLPSRKASLRILRSESRSDSEDTCKQARKKRRLNEMESLANNNQVVGFDSDQRSRRSRTKSDAESKHEDDKNAQVVSDTKKTEEIMETIDEVVRNVVDINQIQPSPDGTLNDSSGFSQHDEIKDVNYMEAERRKKKKNKKKKRSELKKLHQIIPLIQEGSESQLVNKIIIKSPKKKKKDLIKSPSHVEDVKEKIQKVKKKKYKAAIIEIREKRENRDQEPSSVNLLPVVTILRCSEIENILKDMKEVKSEPTELENVKVEEVSSQSSLVKLEEIHNQELSIEENPALVPSIKEENETAIVVSDSETVEPNDSEDKNLEELNVVNIDDDYEINFTGFTGAILVVKVVASVAIAASDKGKLFYFNMATGELMDTYDISLLPITSMIVANKNNNQLLYIGSLDSSITIMNFVTKELIKVEKLEEPVQCMEYSWNTLFVGSARGSLIRYDLNREEVEDEIKISDSNVLTIKATQEGPRKVLVIAMRNAPVSIRDAVSGLLLRTMETPFLPTVYTLLFDKNLIYCGTSQHDILVYTFEDGQLIFKHEATKSKGVVCMQIVGNLLFAGCYNGNIYVYNTNTNIYLGTMSGPGGLMLSMEIVNNRIIVGTKSSNFKAWKIPQKYLDQI